MTSMDEGEEKRQQLARALDCFTSLELRVLAGITETTEVAWRKRGTGPAYILFGTEYLYPRLDVLRFIQDRIKVGRGVKHASAL